MENKILSTDDWAMILESLKYTKLKFEEYDKYPSPEFKQKRVKDVNQVIQNIKTYLKSTS